jgi:hypothetical protein
MRSSRCEVRSGLRRDAITCLTLCSTQPDPSDLSAVCSGSNATEVRDYIQNHCGQNEDTAMSAFNDVCGTSGADGSQGEPTPSSSGGATGTGAAATGSPTSTDSIASRMGMDVLGMAAIVVFGALVAGK